MGWADEAENAVEQALADLDEMSFDDDPASVSNVGGIYGGEYMGPSTDEQNFGMSGGGVGPGMGGHPGMGMGGGYDVSGQTTGGNIGFDSTMGASAGMSQTEGNLEAITQAVKEGVQQALGTSALAKEYGELYGKEGADFPGFYSGTFATGTDFGPTWGQTFAPTTQTTDEDLMNRVIAEQNMFGHPVFTGWNKTSESIPAVDTFAGIQQAANAARIRDAEANMRAKIDPVVASLKSSISDYIYGTQQPTGAIGYLPGQATVGEYQKAVDWAKKNYPSDVGFDSTMTQSAGPSVTSQQVSPGVGDWSQDFQTPTQNLSNVLDKLGGQGLLATQVFDDDPLTGAALAEQTLGAPGTTSGVYADYYQNDPFAWEGTEYGYTQYDKARNAAARRAVLGGGVPWGSDYAGPISALSSLTGPTPAGFQTEKQIARRALANELMDKYEADLAVGTEGSNVVGRFENTDEGGKQAIALMAHLESQGIAASITEPTQGADGQFAVTVDSGLTLNLDGQKFNAFNVDVNQAMQDLENMSGTATTSTDKLSPGELERHLAAVRNELTTPSTWAGFQDSYPEDVAEFDANMLELDPSQLEPTVSAAIDAQDRVGDDDQFPAGDELVDVTSPSYLDPEDPLPLIDLTKTVEEETAKVAKSKYGSWNGKFNDKTAKENKAAKLTHDKAWMSDFEKWEKNSNTSQKEINEMKRTDKYSKVYAAVHGTNKAIHLVGGALSMGLGVAGPAIQGFFTKKGVGNADTFNQTLDKMKAGDFKPEADASPSHH